MLSLILKNDKFEEIVKPLCDRIIVYIDDIDQCAKPSIELVFQAIYFLLAFPIFVVVVAADPKKLATINLSKIIQLPFWLHSLNEQQATHFLKWSIGKQGLMPEEDDLREIEVESKIDDGSLEMSSEFQHSIERNHSKLTHSEISLIQKVFPLAASTPRQLKQLINAYIVIKSINWKDVISISTNRQSQFAIISLLAISHASPLQVNLIIDLIHNPEIHSIERLMNILNAKLSEGLKGRSK